MQELINEINAIKNTLSGLMLPPTEDNMDRLLGCQQHLTNVRNKLEAMLQNANDPAEPVIDTRTEVTE